MTGPQIPDDLAPYGANGSGEQNGAQRISSETRPMPNDNLAPYGTQDENAGMRDSSPSDATPAGPREFDSAAQHSRASAAQAPSRDRGPSPDPFDTVPGLGAANIDRAGKPGGLPDPVTRRGSGTTCRP